MEKILFRRAVKRAADICIRKKNRQAANMVAGGAVQSEYFLAIMNMKAPAGMERQRAADKK